MQTTTAPAATEAAEGPAKYGVFRLAYDVANVRGFANGSVGRAHGQLQFGKWVAATAMCYQLRCLGRKIFAVQLLK
jgi:hypothetical protein